MVLDLNYVMHDKACFLKFVKHRSLMVNLDLMFEKHFGYNDIFPELEFFSRHLAMAKCKKIQFIQILIQPLFPPL